MDSWSSMTNSSHSEHRTAGTRLCFEGEMTVRRASELKRVLLGLLDEHGPAELDLSRVSELDGAGLQLLLLAVQIARTRRKELRLIDPSCAVREVFELLHLTS